MVQGRRVKEVMKRRRDWKVGTYFWEKPILLGVRGVGNCDASVLDPDIYIPSHISSQLR